MMARLAHGQARLTTQPVPAGFHREAVLPVGGDPRADVALIAGELTGRVEVSAGGCSVGHVSSWA